ncbi:MAG: GNAT family N-acetyltransferase [Rhodobacteraceae bacterium]|nr:GNAT family N-acetyltransferase [Paracoccaceae bacterium]
MIVRPGRSGDAAALAQIWNHYIQRTTVTFNPVDKTPGEIAEMIAARQAGGKAFVVAEAEGEVIGFATYFQFRGGLGYGHTMEHSILLHPELRGRGAGRALMAAIEDHARAAGVHTMFAGVSAENPSGVAFHEAIGFARVAVLPEVGRKFGRWIDLVLLQKHL